MLFDNIKKEIEEIQKNKKNDKLNFEFKESIEIIKEVNNDVKKNKR